MMKAFIFTISVLFIRFSSFSQSFKSCAEQVGLKNTTVSFNLIGGGLAFFDFNNDGFDDLYVTGGAIGDKLFKNNRNGTFTDISTYANINTEDYFKTVGVTTGDINNDGLIDIFVTTEQSDADILFLNKGEGKFENISISAGITKKIWSTSATFIDFNNDGYLDIYVIGYIDEPEIITDNQGNTIGFAHKCYGNLLYLNNHNNTFTEVSVSKNVNDSGCGLAVTIADYNSDGWQDIYVINDFGEWVEPNKMYQLDQADTSFTEIINESGLGLEVYGMGIASGDFNNDEITDFYVTNIGRNSLLKGSKEGIYEDVTSEAGVENIFSGDNLTTGWGTFFFDFDNDSYEDLAVANGYIPSAEFIETSELDPNKLYRNNGDGSFTDISDASNFNDMGICRGAAFSDFDLDGDLDVAIIKLVQTVGETDNLLFLKNQLNNTNRFLKLILEGSESNRDAIGACAKVYIQGRVVNRCIDGGTSHASRNTSFLHFGIGLADSIDSLKVIWPNKRSQVFQNIVPNSVYYLLENSDNLKIAGCMEPSSENFNSDAEFNFGCNMTIEGCTNPDALNFNVNANKNDNSCIFNYGCTDPEAFNYDSQAQKDDGSCQYILNYEGSSKVSIKVYPNPISTSNLLKIETNIERYHINIKDAGGKLIFSKINQTKSLLIDTTTFSKGLLYVEIIDKNDHMSFKIINL